MCAPNDGCGEEKMRTSSLAAISRLLLRKGDDSAAEAILVEGVSADEPDSIIQLAKRRHEGGKEVDAHQLLERGVQLGGSNCAWNLYRYLSESEGNDALTAKYRDRAVALGHPNFEE